MIVECLRVWKRASMESGDPLLILGWQLADGTRAAPSGAISSVGARGSKMSWGFYPLRAAVEWRLAEGASTQLRQRRGDDCGDGAAGV
ncbi:hypothetical protein GUJ93_ZPchr0004g40183 [Zizania palustris]|uniref:Uncharacterized protein n=1 Tax=Zizania palustris TaxID=103762 RepID=A0A8J5VF92_ZIZPA|nr:hypothetical protein GUJ93_ZPchr0004g40183 [Zizania palustris]